MPINPEHLTLAEIKARVSSSAMLTIEVINDLSEEDRDLVLTYLEIKWSRSRPQTAFAEITNTNETSQPHMLTVTEFARIKGCNEKTIRSYATRGTLNPPAVKIGWSWLIPEEALTSFHLKKRGRQKKKPKFPISN